MPTETNEVKPPSEIKPLSFEKVGGTNLYECEHVTEKTHPIEGVLPVGSHTNIALCKHCWIHMQGMVLRYALVEMLREGLPPGSQDVLVRILSQQQVNG